MSKRISNDVCTIISPWNEMVVSCVLHFLHGAPITFSKKTKRKVWITGSFLVLSLFFYLFLNVPLGARYVSPYRNVLFIYIKNIPRNASFLLLHLCKLVLLHMNEGVVSLDPGCYIKHTYVKSITLSIVETGCTFKNYANIKI